MYRNQYDTDVTTYSPAGRVHQVEYAMEAVKQGSASVGLRSGSHVVIASVKRAASKLASHQRKIFKVDKHCGIVISGLIADGRVLRQYMADECLNHRFVYESAMQVGRLVADLSDKAQVFTQTSEWRPYGVGLLVAGFDKTGPHLYTTDPSGNYYEYVAHSIGARSQSAKTYLEKHAETFEEAKLEELIDHAISALKGTLQDGKLTSANVEVAYVGRGQDLVILEDDDVRPHLERVIGAEEVEEAEEAAAADGEAEAVEAEDAAMGAA